MGEHINFWKNRWVIVNDGIWPRAVFPYKLAIDYFERIKPVRSIF